MELVTVDKFLCCLKLETGAYILGILGTLSNLAAIGLLGFGLGFAIYFYDDFVKSIKHNVPDHDQISFILESQIFMIALFSFLIFLFLISLFASIQLIRGTRCQNRHQLVPYMILVGLGFVLSLLHLLQGTLDAVIKTAINLVINGYIFVCINSLYIRFERMSKCKISEVPKHFA